MKIPKDVVYILKTLNSSGYEAFIVGGCVRDCLLNDKPKDWDITTSAKPDVVKKLFTHTYDTGIKHGTVTVVLNSENYEITTYRIEEEYFDCRHPSKVLFTDNLSEDLKRRDFTINAIAYHPDVGFVDPYDGIKDISVQVIRGVGDPNERFREDALRMMRAIRFSARLNFKIEDDTYNAICNNASLIGKVSLERVHEELDKLLMSDYPMYFEFIEKTKLINYIFEEYNLKSEIQKKNTLQSLQNSKKDRVIRWAILMEDIGDDKFVTKVLRRLKFDMKTLNDIVTLISLYDKKIDSIYYDVRKVISKIGFELFDRLLELKSYHKIESSDIKTLRSMAFEIKKNNDCISLKNLAVNGKDLIENGFEKGEKIGCVLEILFNIVLEDPKNNNYDFLVNKAKKLDLN